MPRPRRACFDILALCCERYQQTGAIPTTRQIAQEVACDETTVRKEMRRLLKEGKLRQPHGPQSPYVPHGYQIHPL